MVFTAEVARRCNKEGLCLTWDHWQPSRLVPCRSLVKLLCSQEADNHPSCSSAQSRQHVHRVTATRLLSQCLIVGMEQRRLVTPGDVLAHSSSDANDVDGDNDVRD
jgi:hypothetical protein